MRSGRSSLKSFLLFFIASVLSYAYALNTGYLGDDVGRIVQTNGLDSLSTALTGGLGDRPLLMLLMWFEVKVLGLGPLGLRLVGLIFHSLVACQIYKMVSCLPEEKGPSQERTALCAAFLFALHPLNSQALTIIIQHGTIMASWFCLLSVYWFYRRGILLSLVMMVLAVLCKPIVVFLPLFYSLVSKRALVLWFVLPLLLPLFFFAYLGKNTQNDYALGVWDYFSVQTEVVANYLRLMVLPYGMKYLYDYEVRSFPWFILLHVALLVLGGKFIRNKFARTFFIGMYLAFIPESSFFPIIHTAFEHRTYLPLAFLSISLGAMAGTKISWKRSTVFGGALIVLLYVGLNQIRNFQLRPVTNWMIHTLTHADGHHSINFDMNVDLMELGHWDEVRANLERYKKYDKYIQYKILNAFYDYSFPERREDAVKRLSEHMMLAWDGVSPRKRGNVLLRKHFDRPGGPISELLELESILAMQMKILFESHMQGHFSLERNYYRDLAHRILKREEEAGQKKIQLLKIKTILQYYYHEKFPGLRKAIEAELKKTPESKVLQRLFEMTSN